MKLSSLSSAGVDRQSYASSPGTGKISIIVPVLDEGARLRHFLEHLRERAVHAEVIVVGAADWQGGSQSAAELCDRIVTAPRGRAAQMNAGARVASGDVFWFVHADSEVPQHCLEQIGQALEDPHVIGGCFRIRFPCRELVYRVSDAAGNLAVEVFGRCYGDHGIFCRSDVFEAVGGYPNLPLLEDAEFYRLIRQHGRTRQLAGKIVTSPRRYQKLGPYRLTASYLLLSILYILRVPVPILARIYGRLCLSADEQSQWQHAIHRE